MNQPFSEGIGQGLKPDPLLTVSEWADRYRNLPSKSSAEPGKWRTSRTPYLKEIMDCLSPQSPVQQIKIVKGTQLGATETATNFLGCIVHLYPGPFLFVLPTLDLARKYSKQKLTPTIECTPILRERISADKTRSSESTILIKQFQGGSLTLAGANSAAGLRSISTRYLVLDDLDAYPGDVEGEGDPCSLAVNRTDAFSNRKILKISSPTVKGASRIEQEYEDSDQRKYHVPCPFCHKKQVLKFSETRNGVRQHRLIFEHDAKFNLIGDIKYQCEHCHELIDESSKTWMLENGEWIADNPGHKFAGFMISSLYSPAGWISWVQIVEEYLKFKKTKDHTLLKRWVNTRLAECWEVESEKLDDGTLYGRREPYGPEIPQGGLILTAGVDIQDDRLECELVCWSHGEESWSMDYRIFYGSPDQMEVWRDLDHYLLKPVRHSLGFDLKVSGVGVDTGGHFTESAYRYCKKRRRTFALKGSSKPGQPIVSRPTFSNLLHVRLFPVGSDTAKEIIFTRLKKITEPGPGYMHFPMDRDEEYFLQLTAEAREIKKKKGFDVPEWKKIRARNEALDCRIYALVALHILRPNYEALEAGLKKRSETLTKNPEGRQEPEAETDQRPVKKNPFIQKRRGGFIQNWRW
jgi:phage terminase large subunit GpA-like protein